MTTTTRPAFRLARPAIARMQTRLFACLLACLMAYTQATPAAAAAAAAARPNIVFILFDDAGFSDFGAYGSEIATPNIDQIAHSGARLSNFHTASTCEASRAMLMSGIDNHRAGAGTLQVVIADNQRGKPGYEGHLSERAHSLGQLMRDGGYATYYAGKWNLGNGVARAPGARGWERYIGLEQTGADNFEDGKVYAPLNREAVRWEDGKRAVLPPRFYSTSHYVDRLMRYMEDGKTRKQPFFAMLALQAVHSPLQAPDADIAKYQRRYDAGWAKIRYQRYRRQVAMGLVPPGLTLSDAPGARPWDRLSPDQRRAYARKMAVFAAMLDNADQQIGRLRDYLRQSGQLDNTVFVVMSDNGADPYELNRLNLPFRLWYNMRFNLDTDTLGQPGSYAHYGQDWAAVSNTPFSLFKGTASEGGMRVPFIISYPPRIQPGLITRQFAYMTDVLPTMLDLAGIAPPGTDDRGLSLLRPAGSSLLPHLEGRATAVHQPSEAIGFEASGAVAVFKGDYKLVRNIAPFGDGRARLINLADDPLEQHDLSASRPDLLREMQGELARYTRENGVVQPPPGFNPVRQLLLNNWPILARQLAPPLAGALLAVVGALALAAWLLRRWHRRGAA